jgi:four helix bundle protein
MGPGSVRTLEIWQDGIGLVKVLYHLTSAWPKEEMYGLTSQVRRAAVSIPSNIAEGVGRATAAEIVRFSQIALGSAYELDTLLTIALGLGFSPETDIQATQARLSSLCKRISGFIRHQEQKR